MTTEQFRQLYKYVNAIYSGDYIIFKVSKHRWELYHIPTEETQIYKTFDELAKNEVVAKIIETYVSRGLKLDMPKGSREGQRDTFGDAEELGTDETVNDFPSRVNVDKEKSTEEKTLQQFRKMYANAEKEHGFAVDEQGYITTYKHGNRSSVSWTPEELKDRLIYHNHPSGGAFSKADMSTTAQTGARGIVASGRYGDYIFIKTQKFDAVGFQKALASAKTTAKDYNEGGTRSNKSKKQEGTRERSC